MPGSAGRRLARGDELIGHGHTNAHRQSEFDEAGERALLVHCRERIAAHSGRAPGGWLFAVWISENPCMTPDPAGSETGSPLHR